MKKLLLSAALITGSFLYSNAQSLNFDGNNGNDDAAEASSLLLTGTTNVTMEAWVYSPGASNFAERIVYNGNSSTDGYGLYIIGGDISILFGGINVYDTYYSLPSNTWSHLALVNDGSVWAVYLNGQPIFGTMGAPIAPTANTTIGGTISTNETFTGTIDEVRLWSIGRTQTQINDSMHCSISGPVANLVANYNFNQGTPNADNTGITTLSDISGNSNDMTLSNFTLNGTSSNWVDDANISHASVTVSISSVPSSVPPTGAAVTFTADLTLGGSAPTYQWYKNGTLLSGETASTYADPNITAQDSITCAVVSSTPCIDHPTDTSEVYTVLVYGPAEALNFDGNDDYVSIATGNNIPVGDNNYTIEAWVNTNYMGTLGVIGWGNYGTNNQVNALRIDASGIDNYWWGNDLIVNTPDLSGAWHHIAATYDGTDRKIYLDGVMIGSDVPGTGVHAVPATNDFNIGLTNPSGSEYFSGSIDEVRIWNVARTATEIMDNMNCSITTQAGLVSSYTFNEGIANQDNTGITTLFDNTSNANDGTLNNFDLTGGPISNWTDDGKYNIASANITTPFGSYANSGDTVFFVATAINGGSNPSYQWMVNGMNVGTDTSVFISSTLPAGADEITCVVTSSQPCVTGSAASNPISLTVLPPNCVPYIPGNCYDFGNIEYCDPLYYNYDNYYYNYNTGDYGSAMDEGTILSTGQSDAYDGIFEIALDDTAHTYVDGAYYDTLAHTMQAPYQMISGISASKELQFYTSMPIVRVKVQLRNNSNMPRTTRVNIASNLGSDGNTTLDTCSTGSATLSDSVRWMTTWDTNNFPNNDPVNTFARYGKGNIQSQPHFKNKNENGDDYYDDSVTVTIPPHSTRYIVMFNRLDSTTDAARLNVGFFDDLQMMMNDSMFIGIDSLENVVNWNLMKPVPSYTGLNTGCDSVTVGFTNTSIYADSYTWDFGDGSPVDSTVSPTHLYASGNYTVTLTAFNNNGLDSTITQSVVAIAPAIDVTTSLSGATITANNGTAAAYQWLDCNNSNSAIGGANSQSYTATLNGNYAVQIVTNDGCIDTSACVAITNIGLKAYATTGNVSIYPNPATDKLTVTLSSNTEKATLELVDVMGRVVYSGSINANETNKTIDLANFGSGVYQLRISNSTGTVYQNKLIKQ